MVRVMLKKRIIALILCVALTVGTVSIVHPTESKGMGTIVELAGTALTGSSVLEAIIAALGICAGIEVSEKIEDKLKDYFDAGRCVPIQDSLGNRFIAFMTENFVHKDAISYSDINDYYRAMDPARSLEIVNDENFICATPYITGQEYMVKPDVISATDSKLKQYGTSLSTIMNKLGEIGLTSYTNFVDAIKDLSNGTTNVLVNENAKSVFDVITKLVSNVIREVWREKISAGNTPRYIGFYDIKYKLACEDYLVMEFNYTKSDRYPNIRYVVYDINYGYNTKLIEAHVHNENCEFDEYGDPISCRKTYNLMLGNLKGPYRANYEKEIKDNSIIITMDGWSEPLLKCTLYDPEKKIITNQEILSNFDFIVNWEENGYSNMSYCVGSSLFYDRQSLIIGEKNTVYTGSINTDMLQSVTSTDKMLDKDYTYTDSIPWLNSNPSVADADVDALELADLLSKIELINKRLDETNALLENLLSSIKGMASTVTGIQGILGTGLSAMLTGAADRVVEGFRDIYIDNAGDNILEKACTGIENIFEGVGDMTALKEDVIVIREAAEAQITALTTTDAMTTELTVQLGNRGPGLQNFFNIIYLIILILIEILMLFLRCFQLIVSIFKVEANPRFLPPEMIQGIDFLKDMKITAFNISIWDFMFVLIYIILVFRIVGSIKCHVDDIEV